VAHPRRFDKSTTKQPTSAHNFRLMSQDADYRYIYLMLTYAQLQKNL